jgi:phosphopantothenoylcysteine decarboxylase / phosphopantothenate---cysteine ligase
MTTDGVADAAPFVVVGVSGGIAAYKVVELVRGLRESGATVQVIATASALEFVGAPTWEAISGRPVMTSMWQDVHSVPHVRLAQEADAVVVAPATADLLARTVHGRSDDLLTATILTARGPVILAPAMHTEMWENDATVANVAALRARGIVVVEPAVGRLTGGDSGPGRLPDPQAIIEVTRRVLDRGVTGLAADLHGRTVLITAGGTREPIDPVRWIGNRSSGKQGYALARAAVARGAQVTLVSANVDLPDPAGALVLKVESAEQMRAAVTGRAGAAHAIVMAAAVADHRPQDPSVHKTKKHDGAPRSLALIENPDILAGLVKDRALDDARRHQVLVGFAAETGDDSSGALDHAKAKMLRKGCDLLIFNDVSQGRVFGSDHTSAMILSQEAGFITEHVVIEGSKDTLADAVWDAVVLRWSH